MNILLVTMQCGQHMGAAGLRSPDRIEWAFVVHQPGDRLSLRVHRSVQLPPVIFRDVNWYNGLQEETKDANKNRGFGSTNRSSHRAGGKWVAWNAEHTRIVAHADTLMQLWKTTKQEQIDHPVFEKVPRANVRFVGTR